LRMRRRATVRAVVTMEAVPAVAPPQAALQTAAVLVVVVAPVNFVPVLVLREEVQAARRKAIAVGMDAATRAAAEVTVDESAIVIMCRGRNLLRSLSD
jgi:hypothetical protein